jgi:hypothetical protein
MKQEFSGSVRNVEKKFPVPLVLSDLPARSSKALAQMFECGNAITADNDIVKSVQSERQKEMEMLVNRWNKNKQLASSGDCSVNVHSESSKTPVLDVQMKQVT